MAGQVATLLEMSCEARPKMTHLSTSVQEDPDEKETELV